MVSDEPEDLTVPDLMQQYQEQIASYIQSGNFGEAEECYLECKTSYPQEEKVYLYAADIYLAQDDYDKAIEILQEGAEVVDAASLTERIEYVAEYVKLCKEKWEADGSISSWEEWEYDDRGNLVKEIAYNSEGDMIQVIENRVVGEPVKASFPWLQYEYRYDSLGNTIWEFDQRFADVGNVVSESTKTYTYTYAGTLLGQDSEKAGE